MSRFGLLGLALALALECCFLSSVSSLYTCDPLSYRIGVRVNCEHPVTRESINCKTEKVPIGTTAYYKCDDYYVSQNGAADEGGQIKCNGNGEWSPRNSLHGFSCNLDCGKPGQVTKWPWHAAIFYRKSERDSFQYSCGGTLINPLNKGFAILIVATCFPETPAVMNPANIRVALGLTSTEFARNAESNYASVYSVNKMATNARNGLTLLSFDKEVELDDTVLPICFDSHSSTLEDRRNELQLMLIGFEKGRVEDLLRKVSLNRRPCLSSSSNSNGKRNDNFCMGLKKNSAGGICTGDIGGGLISSVVKEDGSVRYKIQGVLTDLEAEVYDDCSKTGIFNYASNYTQWISEQVEKFNSEEQTAVLDVFPEATTIRVSFHRETVAPIRKTPIIPPTTIRPLATSYRSVPRPQHRNPQIVVPTIPTTQRTTTDAVSRNPSDFQQVGLDWHNFYRRKHGVSEVALSDGLNAEAQWEAEQWINNHKYKFQGVTNWFGSTRTNWDSSQATKAAIQDWYKTFGGYNWTNPTSLPFTHIVWKSTSQIGIGVARKGEDQVVVAKYLRPIYFQHEHDQAFQENILPPTSGRSSRQ